MTVATTTQRIADMLVAFKTSTENTGSLQIQAAFRNIPRKVTSGMLPAVIIFPGIAQYNYDAYGENIVSVTREYRLMLLIRVSGTGSEGLGQTLIEPYFDAIRQYFERRPGLELETASEPQTVVDMARMTGDAGYVVFEYPDGGTANNGIGQFDAIQFDLEVTELVSISYKD